jgi:hypothetical protein
MARGIAAIGLAAADHTPGDTRQPPTAIESIHGGH